MKVTEFMIGISQMCNYYSGGKTPCTNEAGELCPLANIQCDFTIPMTVEDSEKVQAIVDKWVHRGDGTNEERFKAVFGMNAMEFWSLSDVNAQIWLKQRYEAVAGE